MQKELLKPTLTDRAKAFITVCATKLGDLISNGVKIVSEVIKPRSRTAVFATALILVTSAVVMIESFNPTVVQAANPDQKTGIITDTVSLIEAVAPKSVHISETDPITYTYIKETGSDPVQVEFNPAYPYIGQLTGEQFLAVINGSTKVTTTLSTVSYTMHKGDQVFAIEKQYAKVVNVGKDDVISFQGEVGKFSFDGRAGRIDGQGGILVTVYFHDTDGSNKKATQKLTAPLSDIVIGPGSVYGIDISNAGLFYNTNGQVVEGVGAPFTLFLPKIDNNK